MKLILFLCLLSICSWPAYAGHYPTDWGGDQQARLCAARLYQAVAHSDCPFATGFKETGNYKFMEFRYRPLTCVKVKRDMKNLYLELHYSGRSLTLSCSISNHVDVFPQLPWLEPKQTGFQSLFVSGSDNQGGLFNIFRDRYDRQKIGSLAAKRGYDAAYDRRRLVLAPKYYRRGMNDDQFIKATKRTIAWDVETIDRDSKAADARVYFGRAMDSIAHDLNQQIHGFGSRRYDWREFPLSIQNKIKSAIALSWTAQEWGFISFLQGQADYFGCS